MDPQPGRIIVGLMGGKGSGKTALGIALREVAASETSVTDIEFSDPIIEAANHALRFGEREPSAFRWALVAGAVASLGYGISNLGKRTYHQHGAATSCPECDLVSWLDCVSNRPALQINLTNKDANRAPLSWLGVVIRQLADETAWAQAVSRRINVVERGLITVGGVRFPGDAGGVQQAGGRIIKVLGIPGTVDTDPANAHSIGIAPDIVIDNGIRDFSVLAGIASRLWSGLKSDSPLPMYGPI